MAMHLLSWVIVKWHLKRCLNVSIGHKSELSFMVYLFWISVCISGHGRANHRRLHLCVLTNVVKCVLSLLDPWGPVIVLLSFAFSNN